jgi:hypothetical protein
MILSVTAAALFTVYLIVSDPTLHLIHSPLIFLSPARGRG